MNPGNEPPPSAEALSALDVQRLLATVGNPAPTIPTGNAPAPADAAEKDGTGSPDFRNPMLLSPGVLRKLRLHQEEFITELSTRLSMYLRLEVSLKLAGLQTISCQKLTQGWTNPTHLTLFKLEPLRGISVLEIPPALGLCFVDRLMGGPGRAPEHAPEISEIERALLEQVERLILGEWCSRWMKVKELRGVLLSHESNPRFAQVAASETIMFVLSIQVRIGEHTEKIQISIPFAPLEPLILQLTKGAETSTETSAPAAPRATPPWNPIFADLCVPVTAEWHATEMAARDVLALKVGDVIRMDPSAAGQIVLRLGEIPRFQGRAGTIAGQWAVELTRRLKD
jgi:flagellar motor switch protein FliM